MSETKEPRILADEIADEIADELFSNYFGDKAIRLALVTVDGRNAGGWGKTPARDHIAEIIRKHLAGKV